MQYDYVCGADMPFNRAAAKKMARTPTSVGVMA